MLLALSSCRSVPTAPPEPSLPIRHSSVRQQLVFYSDFPLAKNHRLVDELTAQREQLSEKLALPTTDEPIHVFLFRSPESFDDFIRRHHPDFPSRRAFFVESDTQLAVFAHWGDRVAEDLRHEVAHGYLHAAISGLPLWLDEGLAEYFETPPSAAGLHRQHVAELLEQIDNEDWRPDIARLETLTSVAEMTQLDYAEAWAWVYWLLETDDARRDVMHGYLEQLRTEASNAPLSLSLRQRHYQPNETLREFILSLRE
jgi:hypothetical protein